MINTRNLKKAVRTHLDISTAHIEQSDHELLLKHSADMDAPIIIDRLPHWGFRFHLDPGPEGSVIIYKTRLRAIGFSESFCDLVGAACAIYCDFINFDPDGTLIDGIPTFEW